jgi:O-antigen/teichoic acid export membrane protein
VSESGVAAEAAATTSTAIARDEPRPPQKKFYAKTAKVGALWAYGGSSVTQLLGIPSAVLLARLLTPADFGIAAAAAFFIQLGKNLGNLGLNTALVRLKDVREEHRASVFFINLSFGLVAWTTLMLSAPWIGSFYNDDRVTGTVRLASTVFLVNFLGAVEHAVLRREMKFRELAIIEWLIPVFFLPTAVVLAWAGWGYWSLVIGQLVANTASTFGKVYFGGWRPSLAVTRQGLSETVPFGLGVYAKRLLNYTAENLDSLIVGGLFGVTSLGFYEKAFNGAAQLSTGLAVSTNVVFRIFAIIHEDRERFVRAYTKVILAGTIVALPVFAGLIVAAREFVVVTFGEKWLPAVLPFQILCAAGAVRVLSGYASAAIQASGQIWSEVWRKVAQVGLLVGLIFVFRGGEITGAAAAVFVAAVIFAGLMQNLTRQIVGLSWAELLRAMRPSAMAALGTAIAVAAVTVAVRYVSPGIDDWLVLLLQVSAGGGFWAAFMLFVPHGAVQDLVDEVLDDVAPQPVRRVISSIRAHRKTRDASSVRRERPTRA